MSNSENKEVRFMFNHEHNSLHVPHVRVCQSVLVTTEFVWNILFHLLVCAVFFSFFASVNLWRLRMSNRDRQRNDFGAQPSCTEWPAESDTCVVELQRLGPLVPSRGWGRESRCTPIASFLIFFPVSFVLFAQPHTLRLSRPLLAVCRRTWLAAFLC